MKTHYVLSLILLFSLGLSCQKTKTEYIYGINEVEVVPPSMDKVKRKTDQQYISILYANLFQKALAADKLVEIEKCIQSIGDKEVAYEVVVSNFMNDGGIILPSTASMRQDIDKFVIATYKRFYVREPSVAERVWWKNYITANPQVTPELVYMSFALSEEYMYY